MENLCIEPKGLTLILRVTGELTKENSAALKKAVEQGLNDNDPMLVGFDMSEVSLMDSSGIGFLVSLNTTIQGMGRQMVLFGMAERVRKTLELVQLDNFFTIVSGESDLPEPSAG